MESPRDWCDAVVLRPAPHRDVDHLKAPDLNLRLKSMPGQIRDQPVALSRSSQTATITMSG